MFELPVRLAGEDRVGAPGTAEYGRKREVTEQSWVCVHQPPGAPHHRRHHTHSCRGTGEPNVRESKHLQVKRRHHRRHHHQREAVSLRPSILSVGLAAHKLCRFYTRTHPDKQQPIS